MLGRVGGIRSGYAGVALHYSDVRGRCPSLKKYKTQVAAHLWIHAIIFHSLYTFVYFRHVSVSPLFLTVCT